MSMAYNVSSGSVDRLHTHIMFQIAFPGLLSSRLVFPKTYASEERISKPHITKWAEIEKNWPKMAMVLSIAKLMKIFTYCVF